MDWKEFIPTTGYKEYRKRQAKVIAAHLHKLIRGSFKGDNTDPAELRGAIDMAGVILALPLSLIKDGEWKENLNKDFERDLSEITAQLVRDRFNNLG